MSLLRQPPTETCACRAAPSTGTFSLRVEPRTTDVRESSKLSPVQQLQELFFPNLSTVDVQEHGNGYHVHPEHSVSVAHIGQLHAMLDEDSLVARVQITPDAEHTAVAASLTSDHIHELLHSGTVDLAVPLHSGVFRMHSTKEGRITAVEYTH